VSATSSASQDVRLASGAFTKTPYGLEWATFPTSTGALEALNADALDLAVDIQATAPLFAQANAKTPWTRRNAPIRLIAAAEPPPGGLGIFVRTGSGIRSMADLKGRKVAYSRGSNSTGVPERRGRRARHRSAHHAQRSVNREGRGPRRR
jgi:sulfonate transport system substrate-binding protein